MSTVPQEAVEAAARAAAKDEDASNWDDEPQYYRDGWLNRMQVALEAAAPYLIREARAAELEAAAEAIPDAVYTATVNAILRARATAIRDGDK